MPPSEINRLAESVSATEAAGVDASAQRSALVDFASVADAFRGALDRLDETDDYQDEDPIRHAKYIVDKIIPLMAECRRLGDQLEVHVAADLWPLPSYREMLFIR